MAFKFNPHNQRQEAPAGQETFITGVNKDNIFIPKEGQYRFRILPPWSSQGLFAKHATVHFRQGVGGQSFVCPEMWGERCVFCETYQILRPNYQAYEKDIALVRPIHRYYSNIFLYNEQAKGVQLYSFGKKVYALLLGFFESADYGDISDVAAGCDLTLVRTGSGQQVQDVIYPARQFTPLPIPTLVDQIINLDTIFEQPDLNSVKKAFDLVQFPTYIVPGKHMLTPPPLAGSTPPPSILSNNSMYPVTPPPNVNPPVQPNLMTPPPNVNPPVQPNLMTPPPNVNPPVQPSTESAQSNVGSTDLSNLEAALRQRLSATEQK